MHLDAESNCRRNARNAAMVDSATHLMHSHWTHTANRHIHSNTPDVSSNAKLLHLYQRIHDTALNDASNTSFFYFVPVLDMRKTRNWNIRYIAPCSVACCVHSWVRHEWTKQHEPLPGATLSTEWNICCMLFRWKNLRSDVGSQCDFTPI